MPNVWLISTINTSRVDLISHFLNHYRGLGIENMAIFVHADPTIGEKVDTLCGYLDKYGVEPAGFYCAPFHPKDAAAQRNRFLVQNCHPSDWVVMADADEFHEYNDGLEETLRECEDVGYDHVTGYFNDRIREDGSLAYIHQRSTIWEQFPRSYPVTKYLAGGLTHKVVVMRARLEMRDANHHVGGALRLYAGKCTIHHFKWDLSIVARMRRRAVEYKRLGIPWVGESEAVFAHIEENNGKLNLSQLEEEAKAFGII